MSDKWAGDIARRVAERIKALRGDRSGQWLSDRTDEFGHRVSRSTISELENGKRSTVAVDALIVLAAALDVPVVDLLYPGWDPVEILPGRIVPHDQALQCLLGDTEALRGMREKLEEANSTVREGIDAIRKLIDAVDAMKAGGDPILLPSTLALLGEYAEAGRALAHAEISGKSKRINALKEAQEEYARRKPDEDESRSVSVEVLREGDKIVEIVVGKPTTGPVVPDSPAGIEDVPRLPAERSVTTKTRAPVKRALDKPPRLKKTIDRLVEETTNKLKQVEDQDGR